MLEFAKSAYFKSNGYESLDSVDDILSELDVINQYMDDTTLMGKEYICFQWFVKSGADSSGLRDCATHFVVEIGDEIGDDEVEAVRLALNNNEMWIQALDKFVERLKVCLCQRPGW
jgi:hypothetical protein